MGAQGAGLGTHGMGREPIGYTHTTSLTASQPHSHTQAAARGCNMAAEGSGNTWEATNAVKTDVDRRAKRDIVQ